MILFFLLPLVLLSSQASEGSDRLIRLDWETLSDQTTIRYFNPTNYIPGQDLSAIWSKMGHNISCRIDQDDEVHVEAPQGFDASKNIKAFSHGFMDTVINSDNTDFVNAWMEASEKGLNVILVDWSNLAYGLQVDWDDYFYDLAAKNSIDVGEFLGRCLAGLSDDYSVPADNIHLVGHSLGAHLMGKAARSFGEHQAKGDLVGRLTGLDPAGPRFFDGEILYAIPELAANIITAESAKFVDIIHTNGGFQPTAVSVTPHLGAIYQMGHMDFFPDGGEAQAGCFFGQDALPGGTCSHMRSVMYYIHSIRDPSLFPSVACPNVEDCNQEIVSNTEVIAYMGDQDDQFYLGGRQFLWHDVQFCHWTYTEYSNWLCV